MKLKQITRPDQLVGGQWYIRVGVGSDGYINFEVTQVCGRPFKARLIFDSKVWKINKIPTKAIRRLEKKNDQLWWLGTQWHLTDLGVIPPPGFRLRVYRYTNSAYQYLASISKDAEAINAFFNLSKGTE